jgi:hypothetical protein
MVATLFDDLDSRIPGSEVEEGLAEKQYPNVTPQSATHLNTPISHSIH